MKTKILGGNLLLLLTALIWGFAFTAQKVAGDHIPAVALNAIRFLLGTLVLIPAILVFDRVKKSGRMLFSPKNRFFIGLTKRELIGGAVCGVVLLLATVLQQFGLVGASPGKASFLTALYMAFVPFYGLIRKKIASWNVWLSVVIALVGAYLLTTGTGGGSALTGYDFLLLGSAACFGLHITLIDIFSPGTDPVRLSAVQFFVAGVIAVPGAFIHGVSFTGTDLLTALPHLLYLGGLSCGVAYTCQVIGQQMSGTPTIASLIMSLESVFGLVGGVIFLDETMTAYQVVGCAVILAAIVLSQIPLGVWWARVRRKHVAPSPVSDPTAVAPPDMSDTTALAPQAEFSDEFPTVQADEDSQGGKKSQ